VGREIYLDTVMMGEIRDEESVDGADAALFIGT
jgi:hypothetical protein